MCLVLGLRKYCQRHEVFQNLYVKYSLVSKDTTVDTHGYRNRHVFQEHQVSLLYPVKPQFFFSWRYNSLWGLYFTAL